ncbi:hypothetical protein ACLBV5_09805 [Brevundimonas sp. M1A4_2e]
MIVRLPKAWKLIEKNGHLELRKIDPKTGEDITETPKAQAEIDEIQGRIVEVVS